MSVLNYLLDQSVLGFTSTVSRYSDELLPNINMSPFPLAHDMHWEKYRRAF